MTSIVPIMNVIQSKINPIKSKIDYQANLQQDLKLKLKLKLNT